MTVIVGSNVSPNVVELVVIDPNQADTLNLTH